MGAGQTRTGPLKIELSKNARKQLTRLPAKVQVRIGKKIAELAVDPFMPGTKKLEAMEIMYRARVGDYRILYDVEPGVLFIAYIENRREAYR